MPMTWWGGSWELHAENTVPSALPAHKSLVLLVNESATTELLRANVLAPSHQVILTKPVPQISHARYP
jgi:hypothetical protein